MEWSSLRSRKGQSRKESWENEVIVNVKYLAAAQNLTLKVIKIVEYSHAHNPSTPKNTCKRKELSSVFSLRPSGQSSSQSRALRVKSMKMVYNTSLIIIVKGADQVVKGQTLSQSCTEVPMTSLLSHKNAPAKLPSITSFNTSQMALLKL
jgi:hypothetical protein